MPTVAEQLRHAREAQHLDVYQVAEVTKIKTDHIRALESGDFNAFTAPVYIRGFVRTYARCLKLDEAQIMAHLDAELAQTDKFSEPPPLTGPHGGVLDWLMLQLSRVTWQTVVLIVACLLVSVLVFAWSRSRRGPPPDPLKNLGPGLYQPAAKPAGEILPLHTNAP
ncbi:MAG: helix-turn-helix domain-containing protein [Verrucomicrobia bacterium]|nr:helix-turn-helix domain-containing protein [Verrucomicrobiota bacterium]